MGLDNYLVMFQCDYLYDMGQEAKEDIDTNAAQAASYAANFMLDLEPNSQQLQRLELLLTDQLKSNLDCLELVELLHTNSTATRAAVTYKVKEFTVQKRSFGVVGRYLC